MGVRGYIGIMESKMETVDIIGIIYGLYHRDYRLYLRTHSCKLRVLTGPLSLRPRAHVQGHSCLHLAS